MNGNDGLFIEIDTAEMNTSMADSSSAKKLQESQLQNMPMISDTPSNNLDGFLYPTIC